MKTQGATQKRLVFDHRHLDVSTLCKADVPNVAYATGHGALIAGDCIEVLPTFRDESFDTIFADPPFNLGKTYRDKTNDRRGKAEYVAWCRKWLGECTRVLKQGGSLFVYNLPKWNVLLGVFLAEQGLDFRH